MNLIKDIEQTEDAAYAPNFFLTEDLRKRLETEAKEHYKSYGIDLNNTTKEGLIFQYLPTICRIRRKVL
jgi:hypothetical protein